MNKNLSYGVAIVLIVIVLFSLIFDGNEKITSTPVVQEEIMQKKDKVDSKEHEEKEYEDVEISYLNQGKERKGKEKVVKKETKEAPVEIVNNKKIYELITTGSNIGEYAINVASSRPIPTRNPSSFPQIPALIHGTLDGKKFSLVIPSDLGVEDFKIKIKNRETGKVSFVNLSKEHIKPGHSSVLTIDTNNLENIELRSDSSQTPPLPPMPNFPKLPFN